MNTEEKLISCPYCGEMISIIVDPSAVPQQYIEDCQVCCRPIEIAVTEDPNGQLIVDVRSDDE